MRKAVSIQGVHKRFGALHALNEVSIEVPQGSFFGLLGPNGAGKSTLINIMAGLMKADAGSVSIMGHDVVSDFRQARQALGVVPQELVYDPFFSVREVLRLQSGYFGHGPENYPWVDELLETLSLSDKADTNLHDLSGGMKRRVLIAQALVHKPAVVVLDEPTAGVDVELRQALWQFTKRLHADGHTIVLTTHYLEEAEALCEEIAILRRGQVVVQESTQVLLARSPHRSLRLTLAQADYTLPEAVRPLVLEAGDNFLSLRLHKIDDHIVDVLKALQGAGIEVIDLHTEEAGLEAVFLDLTADPSGIAPPVDAGVSP
ncbi:MAG: ABC transporter ATP-binding protein [Gammaproteobacteria bacterium]|nr:ABC transporter ATP-binding protein [Gammaproteobacteria bacterium]